MFNVQVFEGDPLVFSDEVDGYVIEGEHIILILPDRSRYIFPLGMPTTEIRIRPVDEM